jgi:L,D-peptidoglycan transpeptidase YkuD (ErfK/YbiS/YcfS/YnhG family)
MAGGEKVAESLPFFRTCILALLILFLGCGSLHGAPQANPTFQEANALFSQGNYTASLDGYARLFDSHPEARDRILFEMGVIHSHPRNGQRDYRKALDCFQRLIREYPESEYRHDSQRMVFSIGNVAIKDGTIAAQQTRIDALRKEAADREGEIDALRRRIADLERKVMECAVKTRAVTRILIEKRDRRLTLFSRGEALKSYRIALGGDPIGPKEREGDNKTPEGSYVIDSKNGNSQYHLSLHLSYPNERDRKRAKELGVSPGGSIMIHGIKNGFSWVGDSQADADWTRGCIAVTDEEIEEIYKLTQIGTAVEIRP